MKPFLIDTHAHLYAEEFAPDMEAVLARAREAGVGTIIIPGTNLETSRAAIKLAEKHDEIFVAVGYHPHDANGATTEALEAIEALSHHPKVVAIGEIGLDYHYDFSPRDVQVEVFKKQIEIAIRRDLPIIVHTRESIPESIDIVKKAAELNPAWRSRFKHPHGQLPPPRGVFHCFVGNAEEVWSLYESGFNVSYPGIVTFKKSPVVETLRSTGFDHIMIETDSPYLAPVPMRGKRNEPAYVSLVAEKLAELFEASVEDIARTTTFNARRLFQIPPFDEPRIVYRLGNSLYVNLTNRCNADCVFCNRKGEAVVKGYNLKIEEEPSANDVITAIVDPSQYNEIVFCGYGEPTIRLEELKTIARWVKSKGGKTRINTDGHGSIINKRNIAPELAGIIDSVSISLNSTDPEQYAKLMRLPAVPYFEGMIEFAKECLKASIDTTMSIVGIPDVEAAKAEEFVRREVGAKFRLRPYF